MADVTTWRKPGRVFDGDFVELVDQRIAKNGCRSGVAMFCGDSGQVVTSRCRPPIHGNGSITNTIQIYCRRQGPRRKLRCMTTETPGLTVVDNLAARIATVVV